MRLIFSDIVKCRWFFIAVSFLGVFTADVATAEPFEDFFDALKRAFTQPSHTTHRTTHKSKSEAESEKKGTGVDSAGVHTPPSERNTRTATRAGGKDSKTGLKYGTPVPGKKGFVTSPFSSEAGYIDVRGFPPGTAVKDPYSGKIILTP